MADLQKSQKQDRADPAQGGEDSQQPAEREDAGEAEAHAFRSPHKENKK